MAWQQVSVARLEAARHDEADVLDSLSETQATTSRLPNGWSVKDLTAHLMAWQQVSVARLEAARTGWTRVWCINGERSFWRVVKGRSGTGQILPCYPTGLRAQTRIRRMSAQSTLVLMKSTAESPGRRSIRQGANWRDGFVRLLALAKEIPEGDLGDTQKYPWLKGYSLFDVLQGTYEHHHEDHLQPLLTWEKNLGQHPRRV